MGPIAALSLLLAAPEAAPQPRGAAAPLRGPLSVQIESTPVCRDAVFTTPPGTSVAPLPSPGRALRLLITTLADTGVGAAVALDGTAVRITLTPRGERLCNIRLLVGPLGPGATDVIVAVDTGRGPPVDVARTRAGVL